jgi:acyl-coenzyme A synthetase/AMP-(fatty) acid ligase
MTATAIPLEIPLVERVEHDVLYCLPEGRVSAGRFVAMAAGLAARLPDAEYVLNLCRGRFDFCLGFAAAVLRGQVSLLSSDRSPARLAELAASYPGLYVLTDEPGDPAIPGGAAVITPDDAGRRVSLPVQAIPVIPATQPAALVFTSGSTGQPVAHRKLWGALVARSADAGIAFGMTAAQPCSVIAMVPPQHMYGFETSVLLPLHAPASVWCGADFYPGDVQAALAATSAPRVLVTTPLQLRALLAAALDLPPLAAIISATAPLPADMAEAAERRWQTSVQEIFGATEVGSIARRRTLDGDVWTAYPSVVLSSKLDADGVSVAHAAGPFAPEFPLSDTIEVLDPAHFRLLGRRTDVVKLGGRRASLAGLSSILSGIDGVLDGAFVAPQDLEHRPTARLLAFAVAPTRSAADILAELRGRIDPVFLPRRVICVDALPRNDVGKLPEAALAQLAAGTSEFGAGELDAGQLGESLTGSA